MITTGITIGLAGLASAPSIISNRVTSNFPAKSLAKGFQLVVNVTDPSTDFTPSIQNAYISSIHVGAAEALIGIDPKEGLIFYRNGTTSNQENDSDLLTNSGDPLSPMGFLLTPKDTPETTSLALLQFGPGTPGVSISHSTEGYTVITPETFVACNTSLEYYQGEFYITFGQSKITVSKDGCRATSFPKGCVPVRLLPECATLPELPKGSYASYEYALDSECYGNVSTIKWSDYGP